MDAGELGTDGGAGMVLRLGRGGSEMSDGGQRRAFASDMSSRLAMYISERFFRSFEDAMGIRWAVASIRCPQSTFRLL